MSATRRFIALLDLAILIAWIAFAVAVYDQLPEQIPTHFGPSGSADAFASRSIGSWFAMPAIGVSVTLLMLGISQLTRNRPDLLNVPGKNELLALPPREQHPFVEQLATLMTLTATSVLLIFAAMHYDMWRTAIGEQRGLSIVSWTVIGVDLGVFLIGLPLWMAQFKRGVTAATADVASRARRTS